MRGPASRFRLADVATTAAFLALLLPPRAARPETAPPPAETSETEAEKKDPVRFKARLGFDESGLRAWNGRWNPVFLAIENRGDKPFDAAVAIAKSRDDDSLPATSYALQVSMAAGTRKELSTLVFVEPGDRRLDIQLHTGRYGSRAAFINIAPYLPEESVVLVCADEPAATAAALARPEEEPDENGVRPQRYGNVLPVARLPADRAGFGDAAAVVLETSETGEIDEARLAALREYVHAGGTLVVSAGRCAEAVRKSPLAALLPATVAGSAVVDGLDLRTTADARDIPPGRVFPGRFTIARLEAPSAPADAGPAAAPTVVEAKAGLGRIVLLAFALSELPRGLLRHEDRLLVGWLLRREPGRLDTHTAAPRLRRVTFSGPGGGDDGGILGGALRNEMDRKMREGLVVRFPPVGQVAVLLAVYCVCLVPLNWILWSWTRRKELAWLTAALLSVGFGIGYYQWGAHWGGTVLSGENVTVIESRPGSPVGRYWSFHSLYSPGHARGDLRIEGAPGFARQAPLLSRLRVSETGRGVRALDYAVRWDPACLFPAFEIYPRAVRTFEAEGTCSLGGGLDVRWDGGDVQVTNRLPWTIRRLEAWNLQGNVVLETALEPGRMRSLRPVVATLPRVEKAAPQPMERWPHVTWQHLVPAFRSREGGPQTSVPGRATAPAPALAAWADADVLHPAYAGYDVGQRHAVVVIVPLEP
jgi:hypothetical protein